MVLTIPGDNLFINIMMGELTKANGGILFDEQQSSPFYGQDHDPDIEFLERTHPIFASGLGRRWLPGNICQHVRSKSCHDVPGLWQRGIIDRAIRARKYEEHRLFRRLD